MPGERKLDERFYEWLAPRVSSAQLSAAYEAFHGLDQALIQSGRSGAPVLDHPDIGLVRRIADMVKHDREFRKTLKRDNTAFLEKALDDFIQFLEESGFAASSESADQPHADPIAAPDQLVQITEKYGLRYKDERSKGGSFWISMPYRIAEYLDTCCEHGVVFRPQKTGCPIYTRDSWCTSDVWREAAPAKPPFDPAAVPASKDDGEQSMPAARDALVEIIRQYGFRYQDNRGKGGALWVVMPRLDLRLKNECKRHGVRFSSASIGRGPFPNQPSWYTKDTWKAIEESAPAPSPSPLAARKPTPEDEEKISIVKNAFLDWLKGHPQYKGSWATWYANLRPIIKLIDADKRFPSFFLIQNSHLLRRLHQKLSAQAKTWTPQKRNDLQAALRALEVYTAFVQEACPTFGNEACDDTPSPADAAPQTPAPAAQPEPRAVVRDARIEAILGEAFPNGIRKSSGIELGKFRKAWKAAEQVECPYSDEQIREQFAVCCGDTFGSCDAKEGEKTVEGRFGQFVQKGAQTGGELPRKNVIESNVPDTAKSLGADLLSLVAEDEYEPLRKCLLEQNILTVKQFEQANPWVFMNRYGLYSIGQRQTLYKQIMARLKPVKEVEPERLYILQTKTPTYEGRFAAEAFAAFCDRIAQKYPLKIRSLLDAPYHGNGAIVLSRTRSPGEYVQIMNPIAYISGTLTAQDAVIYGQWICKMCGEPDCPVSMIEPKQIEKPETNKDDLSQAAAQPSIDIATPKPEIEKPKEEPAPIFKKPEQPVRPESPKQPEHTPPIPANARLTEKTEEVALAADLDGMSMYDLCEHLGATMVATKRAVADSLRIVSVAGRLIHEEAFVDWEEGADRMEKIIDKLLDKNGGYVSAAQLYEYVHADMQMFLNDNDMDDARSVYDIAQHLFEKVGYHGKRLMFQGKNHISREETAVTSILDVIKKFAREQGGFFVEEELEAYLKSVGVKTGNLRGQMQVYENPIFLFYAEHTFITGESIGFTKAWFETVQAALDRLFADMGDHVVLRDIQPWWYAQLPPLPGGRAWTALLLQSVLKHFSPKLKGVRTIYGLDNQTGDTLHAMIVSGTSEISTFADAVIALLVDEGIEQRRFEAEELRQLLVEYGLVAGNELIWKMPKVLAKDGRFAWDADEKHVTIKV